MSLRIGDIAVFGLPIGTKKKGGRCLPEIINLSNNKKNLLLTH